MLPLKMSLYFGWDEQALLQDCRTIFRHRCPRLAEKEREKLSSYFLLRDRLLASGSVFLVTHLTPVNSFPTLALSDF
jgi:hypothetical protein